MTVVVHNDIILDTRSSDRAANGPDSLIDRPYSEPIYTSANSIQASPSPAPSITQTKCPWCGETFELSRQNSHDTKNALKEHITNAHPHIARFSMYDADTDDVNGEHEVVEDLEDSENIDADNELEMDGDVDVADREAEDGEEDEGEIDEDMGVEPVDTVENPVDEFDSHLDQYNQGPQRYKEHLSVEKRLEAFWNIHVARNFSSNYEDEIANLEHIWDYAFRESKRNKRRDTADIPNRPNPYDKSTNAKGEFLPVGSVERFLELLREPESKSLDELYAVTANAAHALKCWQDEYLAIDRLSKLANRRAMKKSADPRKNEPAAVFEDKKESMLYGYKYDPKEAHIGLQNPFIQGGFKPTPAQLRKIRTTAGLDNPNPDGWSPIMKFGFELVPRFQEPPRDLDEGKQTRRRKAAQLDAVLNGGSNEPNETPDGTPAVETENETMISRRQTRSRGGRLPTHLERPQIRTEPSSPGPESRRGITSSRGGRGRGRAPRGLTPQPVKATAGRGAPHTAQAPIPSSQASAPNLYQPTSAIGGSNLAPTTSTQANIPGPPLVPAPITTPIAPAPGAVANSAQLNAGEAIDAAEQARRDKIANSKNPKRTEAMLRHWAKFNREGRVRNPKRTKAQIEADKAAESARKVVEPLKNPVKKRKSQGNEPPSPTKRSRNEVPSPAHVQPTPIQPAATGIPPPNLAPSPLPLYGPMSMPPHSYSNHPPLAPNPGVPQSLPPPPPPPRLPMPYPPHGYAPEYYGPYTAAPPLPPPHGHPEPPTPRAL